MMEVDDGVAPSTEVSCAHLIASRDMCRVYGESP